MKNKTDKKSTFILKSSLIIAITYFVISFFWILFSDSILNFFIKDSELMTTIQTLKGWFFITLSSLIIYFMSERFFSEEKKLRKEIENIFNNSGTPIALIDSEENVLKINDIWKEQTGYQLNEIKNLDDLSKNLFKNDSAEFIKLIKLCFNFSKKSNIGIYSIFSKTDEELRWSFDVSILEKSENKTILIISIVDVTELTKKENLLIQQSKMATMGEMLENITHQWKQPISVITMANSLLKFNIENKGFTTEEQVVDAIENIEYSVKNLTQTIDDFKNFFNPNKEKKQFELNIALNKTFKLIESQLKNNDIELIKELEEINIYGYENELLQVLINIIKNAKEELVKKDAGSRKLLFINTYQNKGLIYIKIKDNAGGIFKENIEKVFDEHFTTKEKEGGSGIGLYMSKQIIETHMNGKLEAKNTKYIFDSISYEGAEFTITLVNNT